MITLSSPQLLHNDYEFTKDKITMYRIYVAMHRMPLNTHINANIQLVMDSFWTLFHMTFFLTFPWLLTKSLTLAGLPDKWSPCIHRSPIHRLPRWWGGGLLSHPQEPHPLAQLYGLQV